MNINSINEARNLFPMAESCVYLDSAHYSPFSTETRKRLTNFINKFTESNFNLSIFNEEIPLVLKEKISRLINCSANEVIIVSSTTHGLNIFANGIPENLCKRAAYADTEFPSIVYSWMNQERLRGIKNYMIPSDKGKIKTEDVEKVIKENQIDVLTVSSVEFLGFRNDLRSLRDITKKYNAMLVVDAIQSIGAVPMNVKEYDLDFLSAGSQKWMMSPAGIGFAYIAERMQDKIKPTYVSTKNVNYDFTNFLDYRLELKADGSAYENSTPNTLGMIGLESALDLFLLLGVESIFKHILNLLDIFVEGINKDEKYIIEADLSDIHRSNILIFSHKDKSRNAMIQSELERKNIFIAIREGYLRISPHLFNNEEDIKKLLLALNQF